MSLVWLKVIFSIAVFVAGAFGVLFPWALVRGAPGDRFITWGDTFAAGVLGGAGLVHLLRSRRFETLRPAWTIP